MAKKYKKLILLEEENEQEFEITHEPVSEKEVVQISQIDAQITSLQASITELEATKAALLLL